jgi:hypothetical protein
MRSPSEIWTDAKRTARVLRRLRGKPEFRMWRRTLRGLLVELKIALRS